MPKTLKFSAALKSTSNVAFGSMIKPIGNKCNMRCNYCYYLDKELQYDSPVKVMQDDVLEQYIRQYIEGNDIPVITFCWHGGEPLMAGLDFYRKAIELQKKYAGNKTIENTLQTNATLLNDDWAKFFADNNFLLGVSIDGPEEVHDYNRMTTTDEPTFHKVMQGIDILNRNKAEFNTLTAVSSKSASRGEEIYSFLKSIGSHYMQFLPVVEHTKPYDGYSRPVICSPDDPLASIASYSITSSDWGRFLVDIFNQWVRTDVGIYYVQMFDATLANWCGVRAGICSMNETCGDALVVEYDGSVYSCDHFVYPDYKLGNIKDDMLKDMFRSRAQFIFGAAKSSNLTLKCQKCAWNFVCHGECPKHRFKGGENYLCSGLQHFFRHTATSMEYMRDLLSKEQPASLIMHAISNGLVKL